MNWKKRFEKDFVNQLFNDREEKELILKEKPSVVSWQMWYLLHMRLPEMNRESRLEAASSSIFKAFTLPATEAANEQSVSRISSKDIDEFCNSALDTLKKSLVDSLSSVQELVLENDLDTAEYQIERSLNRFESTYDITKEKSLLHCAILNRNIEMIEFLLKKGYEKVLGLKE